MDIKLEQYISELLYKHECVIVPRLGGFVARHIPAAIHKEGTFISPPAKSILFNKNLQNNDGLLVNFIMETENVSYNEASERIQKFAYDCTTTLQSKQRIELKGIGILFMNAEQNIQFEPQTDVNYLIESFGLFSIHAEKVAEEKTDKIIELKDRTFTVEKRTSNQKYLRIAAISISAPLLALGIFFSLNNKHVKNTVTSALGLSFETALYEHVNYKNIDFKYVAKPEPLIVVDANGYAAIPLSENNYVFVNVADTISADKTAVKKALRHSIKTAHSSAKYQIVVGCFSMKENAKRLIAMLHSRNIHASLVGLNKNGLHVVSAGSSNNLTQARQLLQSIRQNHPSAWMMENN